MSAIKIKNLSKSFEDFSLNIKERILAKRRLRHVSQPHLYAIFYKPCFVPEVTRYHFLR